MPCRTVAALAAAALALAGCSSPSPDPTPSGSSSPSPSSDAPSTLDELEDALVDEGLVDGALLEVPDPMPGEPESTYLGLQWESLPTTGEQLAVLAEVQERVDAVLSPRPSVTRIVLSGQRADGRAASVDVAVDPGRDVLAELLDITATSDCGEATGWMQDEVDSDGRPIERLLVELGCEVEAADAVELAGHYDAVTAIAPTSPLVGDVHWVVTAEGAPGIHPRMDLEAPPAEGRQALFVDLMTIAVAAGAEALGIQDYGDRVDVDGFVAPGSEAVCQELHDRIVAAGVERRTAHLSELGAPDGEFVDVCFLQS